jgi:general transcription factor 3C polypeptide 3 (transcription factor C subunit 4)
MIGYALGFHCALVFNDEQTVIELARKLITNSDNRSAMAYQLFAAASRFTYGSNWFNAGPSQKYMLRMVKSADFLAMPKDMREKYDFAMNQGTLDQRLARLGEQPNDINAHAVLMYGHMVAVANHSFSALPYYFRVLAMHPDNICVNLSIATMWVQNSMKRQTENRHFGITQGLAFLNRYYELRTATGRAGDIQEAEYNVARMWHYLGLTHLAMPAYEKTLALSAQVQAERHLQVEAEASEPEFETEDYSREAALALQNIYALAGNDEAARAITEEWLVI